MEFSEITVAWQDDNPNLLTNILWMSTDQNQTQMITSTAKASYFCHCFSFLLKEKW